MITRPAILVPLLVMLAGPAAAQTCVVEPFAPSPDSPRVGPVPATVGVTGRTVDIETGKSVPSATMAILDASGRSPTARILTDDQGTFRFGPLAAGDYRLSVARVGYGLGPFHSASAIGPLDVSGETSVCVWLYSGREMAWDPWPEPLAGPAADSLTAGQVLGNVLAHEMGIRGMAADTLGCTVTLDELGPGAFRRGLETTLRDSGVRIVAPAVPSGRSATITIDSLSLFRLQATTWTAYDARPFKDSMHVAVRLREKYQDVVVRDDAFAEMFRRSQRGVWEYVGRRYYYSTVFADAGFGCR